MRKPGPFTEGVLLAVASSLLPGPLTAQAQQASAMYPFDGQWAVVLVCDDIKDKGSFVKGYTYNFVVTVTGGRLEGAYSKAGTPDSLRYLGAVKADGDVAINATGTTGDPSYSVDHVAPGRPYAYHLSGRFSADSGQATRLELRPCTAHFTRLH